MIGPDIGKTVVYSDSKPINVTIAKIDGESVFVCGQILVIVDYSKETAYAPALWNHVPEKFRSLEPGTYPRKALRQVILIPNRHA